MQADVLQSFEQHSSSPPPPPLPSLCSRAMAVGSPLTCINAAEIAELEERLSLKYTEKQVFAVCVFVCTFVCAFVYVGVFCIW